MSSIEEYSRQGTLERVGTPELPSTPERLYQLPPLSFAAAVCPRSPNHWSEDLRHLQELEGPSQWRRQVESALRAIGSPSSVPRASSLSSRGSSLLWSASAPSSTSTSSLGSVSAWGSDFTLGSFRYSFDFGEPEPAWRQVVASAVRLLDAVPGRASQHHV